MHFQTTITRFGCFAQDRLKLTALEGASYNIRIKKTSRLSCLQKLFWIKVHLPNSEKAFVNIGSVAKRLHVTRRFVKYLISTKTNKLHQIIATCRNIGPFAKSLTEEERLRPNDNLIKALTLFEEIESKRSSLTLEAKKGGFAVDQVGKRHLLAYADPNTDRVDLFVSLKKPLGKGGFRTVYPLMDCQTSKVSMALSLQKQAKPSQADQVEREYRFLKTLQNVKQVVKAFFYINNGDTLFLVTKRCSGTFEEIIKSSKISQKKKLHHFIEVLKGVVQIHENSIIHRDLKPQNILYTKKGKIKIIDFNLSCYAQEQSRLIPFCGTRSYQPPEAILRQVKTEPEKIDAWSLGIILYQICEKQKPEFTRLFKQQLHLQQESKLLEAAKNLSFRRLKRSSPLIPVIRGLLNPDPKLRFSVKEALERLQPIAH
jgi:hypothetical protein